MKTLKDLIGESVSERTALIGYLTAHIPGDMRYSDTLNVFYQPSDGSVYVTVNETGAAGGMDSFNGATEPHQSHKNSTGPNAKPADVLKLIKNVIVNSSYLFKRYGKPSKNFHWMHTQERGINAALVKGAIDSFNPNAVPAPRKMSSTEKAAQPLWDGASPDLRLQFLRNEMGYLDEESQLLSKMSWKEFVDDVSDYGNGDEQVRDVAKLVTHGWANIFSGKTTR